ncbi:MAG: hypothetical protein HN921_06965 [Bacteroidetes bacterium]|jgi:hypothetical protein|nr:hypothetical protein [Bacteroidota bacterium]MBT4730106.1 hypothetical protein [Bacteroidota bacterium]MBT4968346.1 hypothetical protein [Bacteroidota bacterium]MBT5991526.1 hypothetical protein [Bacteroidota bacterium]MBT7039566.1 hypothetical protein [Bacteroidota bacterium]
MLIKPNFFIVGAAKAGTTSLYKYLDQHKGIFFSPIKEPNYFSSDINPSEFRADYRNHTEIVGEKYFNSKPLRELHLSFVKEEKYYNQLFEKAKTETAIGECSTSYLFSDVAAKNIKEFNPEAKIIAILRNPTERIYSHYLMGLRFGYTTKNFREAIEEDSQQTQKGWGISKLYIELGMYARQLERYFNIFPKEQIKIYLNEELKNNPQEVISDICTFLEVEDFELDLSQKHNIASIPKNKMLNKFMYQSGLKNAVDGILPKTLKSKLKLFFYETKEVIPINEKDKEFVKAIYKQDITETAKLINKNLENWLL